MKKTLRKKDPVTKIPLIGPTYAKRLSKLNINTVKDFIFHIPKKYKDTSELLTIQEFYKEEEGLISGEIIDISSFKAKGYFIIKAKIKDNTGTIGATWFNQKYLLNTLQIGETYFFDGKLNKKGRYKSINSPQFEKKDKKRVHLGRITPIYECTQGVSPKWLRSRFNFIKKSIKKIIPEPLPNNLLQELKLIKLPEALYKLHFPESIEEINIARKRLMLDEFLNISLEIEKKVLKREILSAKPIKHNNSLIMNFKKHLDFTLTSDQEKSLKAILKDLNQETPMHRLLNGDVGSGKTILAVIAAYLTVQNDLNVLLMAPTTILAQQHYKTFNKYFERLPKFPVKIHFLSSGQMLEPTMFKDNQIIIGTQAILHEKELPQNIGLMIVDEEHRFGVEQRNILKKNKELTSNNQNLSSEKQSSNKNNKIAEQNDKHEGKRKNSQSKNINENTENTIKEDKKNKPHYLSLTATPIPRTLTNILYGDMDISTIKTMPKNRKPVKTFYTPLNKRDECLKWIRDKIHNSNGEERAFIIFPLVEDSEFLNSKAAVTEYEKLSKGILQNLKVGLLHGRMKQNEKDEILMKFRKGDYNILIATSVVEVGIDIPSATVMLIDGAERFGLAQLHQFRGRIGRGDKQSYCYVIPSERLDPESTSYQRLRFFSKHNSGFDVAEYDLNLRGPGEVYGKTQSGIPNLKIADISDFESIQSARKIAKNLLNSHSEQEIKDIQKNLFN